MTLRTRALGALLTLALAGTPAFARPIARDTIGAQIASGQRADVFAARHPAHAGRTVLKMLRPTLWRGNRLYARSEAALTGWANDSAAAAAIVRGDPALAAVVPDMAAGEEPGSLYVEAKQNGVPVSRLQGEAARAARKSIARTVAAARARLLASGKDSLARQLDDGEERFLVDAKTHEVLGWLSIIRQPEGDDTRWERDSDRTMGPGVNSQAFRGRHVDTGEERVLKIMMPLAPGREPDLATYTTLYRLADEQVILAEALRADREILREFGGKPPVPETTLIAAGAIAQEIVPKGADYDRFDPATKGEADRQWRVLQGRARTLFPQLRVTNARQRGRHASHDARGNLLGAFDILSDGASKYQGERVILERVK